MKLERICDSIYYKIYDQLCYSYRITNYTNKILTLITLLHTYWFIILI